MIKNIIKIIINILSFLTIVFYIPGITVNNAFYNIFFLIIIFLIVNLLFKPLLRYLFIPLVIFFLGSPMILVNMIVVYIVYYIAQLSSLKFSIDGILAVFFAALIIWIFSILHLVIIKLIDSANLYLVNKKEEVWINHLRRINS